MADKRSFLLVQYIIDRHHNHEQDLENRFYTMKIVQKMCGKFLVPLDSSSNRSTPIDYTGTEIDIDESNLERFKIQFMLLVGKKSDNTVEKLTNLISECTKEIKTKNKGKTVIVYISSEFSMD